MQKTVFQIITIIIFAVFMAACARPVAEFNYTFKNGQKAPAIVQFENRSQKAIRYEWNFGDGKVVQDSSPVHAFKHSGKYEVQLLASDGKKSRIIKKQLTVEAPDKCLVEIETNLGSMIFELSDATPQHRDNFLKLAEEGYFNDLLFHRVINGFMIQGGDPNSRNAKKGEPLGMGGPGYTVPAEFVDSLVHLKGALSAARQGDQVNPQKRSSGSQFYIVQGQAVTEAMLNQMEARKGFRYSQAQRDAYKQVGGTPALDRDYTVFGKLIQGMEVLDAIAKVATDGRDRPEEDVKMKVTVIK
ncbi:MAG: peptidylprolyl isomerase [Saprospiraceae bacterium]